MEGNGLRAGCSAAPWLFGVHRCFADGRGQVIGPVKVKVGAMAGVYIRVCVYVYVIYVCLPVRHLILCSHMRSQ